MSFVYGGSMTQATTNIASTRGVEVLRGLHVLVVEDNGLLCCVVEEALRDAGCEVVGPFGHLREAMQAAAVTQRIDVALLDINVRGELVSPLAHELQARGVPFVVTSAYQARDLPKGLRCALHLRKPYTDTDLLDRLAELAACRRG